MDMQMIVNKLQFLYYEDEFVIIKNDPNVLNDCESLSANQRAHIQSNCDLLREWVIQVCSSCDPGRLRSAFELEEEEKIVVCQRKRSETIEARSPGPRDQDDRFTATIDFISPERSRVRLINNDSEDPLWMRLGHFFSTETLEGCFIDLHKYQRGNIFPPQAFDENYSSALRLEFLDIEGCSDLSRSPSETQNQTQTFSRPQNPHWYRLGPGALFEYEANRFDGHFVVIMIHRSSSLPLSTLYLDPTHIMSEIKRPLYSLCVVSFDPSSLEG